MAAKDMIIKALGITTYENEYTTAQKKLIELQDKYELSMASGEVLARKVVELEDKLERISADPEKYIWQKCSEYEARHKDDMEHKWYQIGRQDAYKEMGIRNIEAHERGNSLRILENGDIVELMTDLEDVQEEKPVGTWHELIDNGDGTVSIGEGKPLYLKIDDIPNEIEIGDLV